MNFSLLLVTIFKRKRFSQPIETSEISIKGEEALRLTLHVIGVDGSCLPSLWASEGRDWLLAVKSAPFLFVK